MAMNWDFTYDFLDSKGNIISKENLPKVILLRQEQIMIGNIKFIEENSYIDSGGNYILNIMVGNYSPYVGITVAFEPKSYTYNGVIILPSDYDALSSREDKVLPDDIEFNLYIERQIKKLGTGGIVYNPSNYVVRDCSFLKSNTENILPLVAFPSNNTPKLNFEEILLPSVERLGYTFRDVMDISSWLNYNCQLGLKVIYDITDDNTQGSVKYLSMSDNTNYFSCTEQDMKNRFIVKIGKLLEKNNISSSKILIYPYIYSNATKEYYSFNLEDMDKSLDIELVEYKIKNDSNSIWSKPIPTSGELIDYIDEDKAKYFLKRYNVFLNNTNKQGNTIKLDFWLQFIRLLGSVTDNQVTWLGYESSLLWIKPDEDIVTAYIRQGLKLRAIVVPTTHEYLSKYTYEELSNYTHNEIANLNNMFSLKSMYYDLLTMLVWWEK